jgi:uncharacterized protein
MPEGPWLFVSDLHGSLPRYERLWEEIRERRPEVVLLGGDLLPSALYLMARSADPRHRDFIPGYLAAHLEELGDERPRFLVILGNDDARIEEEQLVPLEERGLLEYVHGRAVRVGAFDVVGYSYVPPTPFQLKDWERYDVSRFVDPGCVSPEEGLRTVPVPAREARWSTIKDDLEHLAADVDPSRTVFLFHTPPYRSRLDRAALDGQMVDHAPLDVHVGSIAVRRFIEAWQPPVTLHGHVHESARLTGRWRDRIGHTHAMSAAHDGSELALVSFRPEAPGEATRELLSAPSGELASS